MGKSAQIGLHIWLPDAMEGPTPVSALIHAATMVTAGVFLVAPHVAAVRVRADRARRSSPSSAPRPRSSPPRSACAQNDIKRVLAYSTCSQLGYMFFAAGVGAYGAAIFHLFTHAFFKALLFLGAGLGDPRACPTSRTCARWAASGSKIPITYAMMWIGTLALIGFPGLRRLLLARTRSSRPPRPSHNAFGTATPSGCGMLAAFLTAFYSWPADLVLTFHGEPRADHDTMHHVHESPPVMLVPLFVLAVGAVLAGWLGRGMIERRGRFLGRGDLLRRAQPRPARDARGAVLGEAGAAVRAWPIGPGPLLAMLHACGRACGAQIAADGRPDQPLFYNKWYFDELYDFLFVRPAKAHRLRPLARRRCRHHRPLRPGRRRAHHAGRGARRVIRLQTGYVYHYAFVMLIGVAALVSWYLYRDCSGDDHGRLAAALAGHVPAAGGRGVSSC